MTTYESMFHKTLIDIQIRFNSGAFDHAVQKYPQFWEVESQLINAVREAWKQPEVKVFREALKKWYSLMRKVLDEYQPIQAAAKALPEPQLWEKDFYDHLPRNEREN